MLWSDTFDTSFLIGVTWVISAIIAILFGILICWRLYILRTREMDEQRKSEIEGLIFSYLNNEESPVQIQQYLENNTSRVYAFTATCSDLLKDLRGSLKEQIQEIFNFDVVQNHYQKKINSNDLGAVADALSFYKNCKNLNTKVTANIKNLIHHPNSEIGFAAALALIESEKLNLQFYALTEICKRADISKISILELVVIFSDTDNTDFERRGNKLLELANADDISGQFRIVLVKAMGEMNYITQAVPLFKMLQNEIQKNDWNDILVSALIETLGKLFHQEIIPIIKTILKTDNSNLKISCAKALGGLRSEECIRLLDDLLEDPDNGVRYEAMLQLLKIGDPALGELQTNGEKLSSFIKEQTLNEIMEIKKFRYA